MTRRRALQTTLVLLLLVAAGRLCAEQKFPPPDFTDHPLPATHVEPPASPIMPYVDVALLAAALAAASYLAIVRRSRRGLFVLTCASLLYFGFWREGCICPIGSVQNVALALGQSSYTIPLTVVAFFTLPLLFTVFFGRTFCAAVCPLGAIQELFAVRPVKVPSWLDHALGLLAYVYLGAAVMFAAGGTAFVICRYDPFVALFRFSGSTNMLIFGGCLLAIGLFVGRPYCRYLCPYGAVLGLLSKVSRWHVSITPDECINCKLCDDACPYGAIQQPTVDMPIEQRPHARRRLAAMLLLLPVVVLLGTWLTSQLSVPLSRMHPTVRLAEQVRLEATGQAVETTDASDAFRNTGVPEPKLYAAAVALRERYVRYSRWLGAWIGLVIGVKLVHLSVRRRRDEYITDRGGCVSCGRCFWYCPQEHLRLGLIDDVEQMIETKRGETKT